MIDRAAERVHVCAVIHHFLAHLLGRDVVGRAPNLVGVVLHRRKAEVHELRVAVRIEKNVIGLDIAVDEALIGRAAQGLRHLLADLHDARNVR